MLLRYISMKNVTEEEVLKALGAGPATIEDVATGLSISWAKAQALLFGLAGQGKIIYERKGRMNIFRKRQSGLKPIATVPNWVKTKSLRKLTKEIEQYWLDVSAQDIIEAERGHY
jgi:DNA-binding transcriptional ArsR family regulator